MNRKIILAHNQRVENAGMAFVKGADGKNEFFEKINSNEK